MDIKNYQEITLDVADASIATQLVAHQGDRGTRFIKIKLTQNGEGILLKATYEAIFRAGMGSTIKAINSNKDGDGSVQLNTSTGIITVELTSDILDEGGLLECELSIKEGENVITSQRFNIFVVESILSKGSDIVKSEVVKKMELALQLAKEIGNLENLKVLDLAYERITPTESFTISDNGIIKNTTNTSIIFPNSFAWNQPDIVAAFISANVTAIEAGAFVGCTALTNIYIDNTSDKVSISGGAIPEGVNVRYKDDFKFGDIVVQALKTTNKLTEYSDTIKDAIGLKYYDQNSDRYTSEYSEDGVSFSESQNIKTIKFDANNISEIIISGHLRKGVYAYGFINHKGENIGGEKPTDNIEYNNKKISIPSETNTVFISFWNYYSSYSVTVIPKDVDYRIKKAIEADKKGNHQYIDQNNENFYKIYSANGSTFVEGSNTRTYKIDTDNISKVIINGLCPAAGYTYGFIDERGNLFGGVNPHSDKSVLRENFEVDISKGAEKIYVTFMYYTSAPTNYSITLVSANENSRIENIENTSSVYVEDFGAVGDGVTDDTDAIEGAFRYAMDNKREVCLMAKTYVVTRTIELDYDNRIGKSLIVKGTANANVRGRTMEKASDFTGSSILFIPSEKSISDKKKTLIYLKKDVTTIDGETKEVGDTSNLFENITFKCGVIDSEGELHFASYFYQTVLNMKNGEVWDDQLPDKKPILAYEFQCYNNDDSLNNINGINDNSSATTYRNVNFAGFTGYGISPTSGHHWFYNLNFRYCRYGIHQPSYDQMLHNCWFCRCEYGIYTTSNLNIFCYNAWFDQIAKNAFYVKNASPNHKSSLGGIITGLIDHIHDAAINADITSMLTVDIKAGRCGLRYSGINLGSDEGLDKVKEIAGIEDIESDEGKKAFINEMQKGVTLCVGECKSTDIRLNLIRRSWVDGYKTTCFTLPTLVCFGDAWKSSTIHITKDEPFSFVDDDGNVVPSREYAQERTILRTLSESKVAVYDGDGLHMVNGLDVDFRTETEKLRELIEELRPIT